MGPSGSGKSTLMHILGCLDVPSAGRYLLGGEDVSQWTRSRWPRSATRRIGFVFQQFNLLPSLPAWRNVELPLVYAGFADGAPQRAPWRRSDRVGLADRIDHRPGELSGGQQQRVAVARALVTDPGADPGRRADRQPRLGLHGRRAGAARRAARVRTHPRR